MFGCFGVLVFGCLGVWVFRCLGVWVFGCLGKRVTREGAQKWPKFNMV